MKTPAKLPARTGLLCLVLLPLLWMASAGEKGPFSSFVEIFPNGKIDWDKGYFYGTGKGYPHMNRGSKAGALKVAQAHALSAILQVASGLRVDDRRTLQDLERDKVVIQLRGLIFYEPFERSFAGEDREPFYRVTYRAPMRGVQGLTKKLLPYLRSGSGPEEVRARKEGTDESEDAGPWLVLDARSLPAGETILPAIFPSILTERGETLSDLNTVDEGALARRGMVRYVVSDVPSRDLVSLWIQGTPRPAGLLACLSPPAAWAEEGSPRKKRRGAFIIKDVQAAQGLMKTNLVISESDAREIRGEDASNKVLKNCRVIVIVSSSLGGIEGKTQDLLALYH
ncbi:MAG: hypothetical protein JW821_08485 [Deltaproteobacteria bacterium]|nr:hypothetical protein [Deltaproteobacteria bacterium]